ncbi:MAG TPA: hypothetical protein VKE94_23715 [Gemmataceae bacterium]|nr:hypothetical protein [Gemmataceae bacterium]
MHASLLSPACAPDSSSRRRSRRLAHQFSSLFETIACGARGNRIEGAAYRQGAALNGEARCYQFRDGDGDLALRAFGEPSICSLVRRRLRALLDQADIDLLYLRYCAEWRQAAVADEWGCCRSTIKRREERIRRTLLADPLLQRAAAC